MLHTTVLFNSLAERCKIFIIWYAIEAFRPVVGSYKSIPENKKIAKNIRKYSYSVGETLQERCAASPIVTKVLPPGTYLINVATHCIVDSDKGWRYQAIHVARKVLNVMDVFVFAKVNVSFTNLEPVPPRMDNFVDEHQVKDLIVSHQPELPDVKDLRPVQVYNLAGSSIGLGAL